MFQVEHKTSWQRISKKIKQEIFQTEIKGLLPNKEDWKRSALPITRGSLLGFFLGILPGIGKLGVDHQFTLVNFRLEDDLVADDSGNPV